MRNWNNLLFLMLLCIKQLLSQQPAGYVGCFKGNAFGANSTILVQRPNNGTFCTKICKAIGYLYASTQVEICRCGYTITKYSIQGQCVHKCSRQGMEFCGGVKSMSVYEIKSLTSEITDADDSRTESLGTSHSLNITVTSNSHTTVKVTLTSNEEETSDTTMSATTTPSKSSLQNDRTNSGAIAATTLVLIAVLLGGVGLTTFIIRRKRQSFNIKAIFNLNKNVSDIGNLYKKTLSIENDPTHVKDVLEDFSSNEDVRKSITDNYSEINIGSMDSINTSEAGYSTVYDETQTHVSGTNVSYKTLGAKTSDETGTHTGRVRHAYDYVTANELTTKTNFRDGHSHLEHKSRFRITSSLINDNRNSSVVCNGHLVLEPDGHYIVYD